jgi:hypothetical protein
MAGHLPVKATGVLRKIVQDFLNDWDLKRIQFFKHYEVEGIKGYFQRLTSNYNMDEEHGLEDDEIFCFTPDHGRYIYEIHLDKSKNINQIYYVA